MASTKFYGSDDYIVYPGDVRSLNLSFAVMLIDDYTGERPVGRIQVEIKEIDRRALKNSSGYYFFTGLETGKYNVSINPELYFPEEIIVDMSTFSDPKNPVIEVNGKPEVALKPNPRYPFPVSSTLVRGRIESGSGKPVASLKVGVKGKSIENITDKRGEFVLYFKDIVKTENIVLEINGETEHPIEVIEGKTVSAKKIVIQ